MLTEKVRLKCKKALFCLPPKKTLLKMEKER